LFENGHFNSQKSRDEIEACTIVCKAQAKRVIFSLVYVCTGIKRLRICDFFLCV